MFYIKNLIYGVLGSIFIIFLCNSMLLAEVAEVKKTEKINKLDYVNKNTTKESKKNSYFSEKYSDAPIKKGWTTEKSDFYENPTSSSTSPSSVSSNTNFLYLLLRMLLVMGIIVAIAFWFLRYLKKRQGLVDNQGSLIRSIEDYRLSMQSKIQIVKVVQDYFMLVTSNDGTPYVQKIEDKQSIDEIKIVENQKTVSANTGFFNDLLNIHSKEQFVSQNTFGLPKALFTTRMMREKIKKK